jgi:ABC-type proline/glycine betaine transport system ATPase subunit
VGYPDIADNGQSALSLATDAVGTKIILISHDINQAKRVGGDIKLPTDDEGVHPLSRSD